MPFALASVHLVPPDYLKSDDQLGQLRDPTSREEIYARWAKKIQRVLREDFFEGLDGYVVGGDWNAQRCSQPNTYQGKEHIKCGPTGEPKQMWWTALREGHVFIDQVFRHHGFARANASAEERSGHRDA